MSEPREFDTEVIIAVDALVEAHGVAGAVDELQARRLDADAAERDRIHEALAYLRREVKDE